MPCGAFFSILSTARYSRTKRAQAHAVLPEAVGTGPHTTLPQELHFSMAKIEKRSKEKSAAHVRALKNRTGHYPPRNSRAEKTLLIRNDFCLSNKG